MYSCICFLSRSFCTLGSRRYGPEATPIALREGLTPPIGDPLPRLDWMAKLTPPATLWKL